MAAEPGKTYAATGEREARALSNHNRAIATQEVIEELIKLTKEMSAATQRGVDRPERRSVTKNQPASPALTNRCLC